MINIFQSFFFNTNKTSNVELKIERVHSSTRTQKMAMERNLIWKESHLALLILKLTRKKKRIFLWFSYLLITFFLTLNLSSTALLKKKSWQFFSSFSSSLKSYLPSLWEISQPYGISGPLFKQTAPE